MTTPTFTEPPEAPQRLTDTRAQFNAKTDAFVAWFATLYAELVALVAWLVPTVAQVSADRVAAEAAAQTAVGATEHSATTLDTLDLALTSQSLTLEDLNKGFVVGEEIALVLLSDDDVRMTAVVDAFTPGTGAMDFTVTLAPSGGGTGAGWAVLRKALEGLSPEGVADLACAFSIVL